MIREALICEKLAALEPEQAAAIFAIRKAEGWVAGDELALLQWLDASALHKAAWEASDVAWRAFDDGEDDDLLTAMRDHALRSRQPQPFYVRPWAIAAALLLVVLGGLLLFRVGEVGFPNTGGRTGFGSPGEVAAIPAHRYATDPGEIRQINLADGSRLMLDAASQLEVAIGPASRSVRLIHGQAYFDIAHDAVRPFIVHADTHVVTDMGTSFDARISEGEMKLVLVSGRVSVSSAGGPANDALAPGQQLIARKDGTIAIAQADMDETLAWKQGRLEFHDEPLSQVVVELNRYGKDKYVVRDPKVAALRISGTFHIGDPERFGRTLAQIYPVRIEREGAHEVEIVRAVK